MKKKNNQEKVDNMNEDVCETEIQDNNVCQENNDNFKGNSEQEDFAALEEQIDEKSKKCEEYLESIQRLAAEFDNYKKRTAREKDSLYTETVSDVICAFLPVVDNLERAIQASGKDSKALNADEQSIKNGVDMVFRQMQDALKSLAVEEIKCIGEKFDPQLHNAVMHIEDESFGENEIVEQLQKGYIIKDKVIRHSMVKVAN